MKGQIGFSKLTEPFDCFCNRTAKDGTDGSSDLGDCPQKVLRLQLALDSGKSY